MASAFWPKCTQRTGEGVLVQRSAVNADTQTVSRDNELRSNPHEAGEKKLQLLSEQ